MGKVEKFSWGGLEKFSGGGGGLRKFRGVEIFSGGVGNVRSNTLSNIFL